MGTTLRRLGSIVVGVVLFGATAELAVRIGRPMPREQVVRAAVLPWTTFEGVPQWKAFPHVADVLEGRACAESDARQVAIVGDSVMVTWQEEPQQPGDFDAPRMLSRHLVTRLQEGLGSEWCVRDVAQAGYLPYQSFAALRATHEQAPVDVAVIEVFKLEARYHALGPDLYGIDGWPRTALGTPEAVPLLPDAVSDLLFAHSRAFSYATFALGEPDYQSPESHRPVDETHRAELDWAEAHGVDVVFLRVPLLDRPFAVSAAEGPGVWADLFAEADRRGARVVTLAERLADRDVAELRLDTCCHYAPPGHQAIADVLADVLRAEPGRIAGPEAAR